MVYRDDTYAWGARPRKIQASMSVNVNVVCARSMRMCRRYVYVVCVCVKRCVRVKVCVCEKVCVCDKVCVLVCESMCVLGRQFDESCKTTCRSTPINIKYIPTPRNPSIYPQHQTALNPPFTHNTTRSWYCTALGNLSPTMLPIPCLGITSYNRTYK